MITLKQNDTGIGIRATLSNEDGNINLSDAAVLFLFDGHEIKANILNYENGQVLVTFNKVHTLKTGIFNAEFEVLFDDGRIETFPNDGYLQIKIMKDLGGVS